DGLEPARSRVAARRAAARLIQRPRSPRVTRRSCAVRRAARRSASLDARVARSHRQPCCPASFESPTGLRAPGDPDMSRRSAALLIAALLLFPTTGRAVERAQIPDKYHWDLTALYPTESAWLAAKADLEKRIPGMTRFKGKLGASPASLLAGLSF